MFIQLNFALTFYYNLNKLLQFHHKSPVGKTWSTLLKLAHVQVHDEKNEKGGGIVAEVIPLSNLLYNEAVTAVLSAPVFYFPPSHGSYL